MDTHLPTLSEIQETWKFLRPHMNHTPVVPWMGGRKSAVLGEETAVSFKMELFQRGGSFKIRGAFNSIRLLSDSEKKRGVTAVSAGNHAIAVSLASHLAGVHAKVVMPKVASPVRIRRCEVLGAEVVLQENTAAAFVEAHRIAKEEGRVFIHPFEGRNIILGTASLGYEWIKQAPELEAVVIPVGGGGLIGGVALAMKQLKPEIKIYGVEPVGADAMYQSLIAGEASKIERTDTIAGSLAPPFTLPLVYQLTRKYVDEIVRVTDEDMLEATALQFHEMKLAVEPAGAASLAGAKGALRDKLAGKKVGLICCGANIDAALFSRYLKRGDEILAGKAVIA
ncbi:MAG: threonine/serine dehydratase [Bacteroidota bacterium]